MPLRRRNSLQPRMPAAMASQRSLPGPRRRSIGSQSSGIHYYIYGPPRRGNHPPNRDFIYDFENERTFMDKLLSVNKLRVYVGINYQHNEEMYVINVVILTKVTNCSYRFSFGVPNFNLLIMPKNQRDTRLIRFHWTSKRTLPGWSLPISSPWEDHTYWKRNLPRDEFRCRLLVGNITCSLNEVRKTMSTFKVVSLCN